jgi:hypothetical protein
MSIFVGAGSPLSTKICQIDLACKHPSNAPAFVYMRRTGNVRSRGENIVGGTSDGGKDRHR